MNGFSFYDQMALISPQTKQSFDSTNLFSYLESLPTGVRSVTLDAKDFSSPRFNTNTTSTFCSNCGYKGHSSTQCAVTTEYYSTKTTATTSKIWRVKSKTTSTEN